MNNQKYSFSMYLLGSILPCIVLFLHFNILDSNFLLFFIITLISIHVYREYKCSKWIFGGISIFTILYFVFQPDLFFNALSYIYNCIVKVYNRYLSSDFMLLRADSDKAFLSTFLLIIVLHIGFTLLLKYLFKKEKRITIAMFLLLCVSPIFIIKIKLNSFLKIILFAYLFSLFIPLHKENNALNTLRRKQVTLIFLVSCTLLTVFPKIVPEEKVSNFIPETIKGIRENLNDTVTHIMTSFNDDNEIDLMNAKNRRYANRVDVKVSSTKKETIYLKEKVGSVYEENMWKPLSITTYANIPVRSLNSSFLTRLKSTAKQDEKLSILVIDLRIKDTFTLYPYYMYSTNISYDTIHDSSIEYNIKGIQFDVVNMEAAKRSMLDDTYTAFAKENYVEISEEIKTLFEEEFHLDEYGKLSIEEANEVILSILHKYTYTLSPGATPADRDFVEYFLLENKKGYCVHFATVATLMYRYFGIPARYVEGYCVHASSFEKNLTTYLTQYDAEVLDSNAHAWVEVYDEERGWTYKEVTVGRSESVEDPIQIEDEKETTQTTTQQESSQNQETTTTQNNSENIQQENIQKEEMKEFSLVEIACALMFFYALFYVGRISYRKKKFKQTDCKKACYAVVNYLHKLETYEKGIDSSILNLLEKNKYSKEGISETELNEVKEYAKIKAKSTFASLNLFKKFKFIFIDMLM